MDAIHPLASTSLYSFGSAQKDFLFCFRSDLRTSLVKIAVCLGSMAAVSKPRNCATPIFNFLLFPKVKTLYPQCSGRFVRGSFWGRLRIADFKRTCVFETVSLFKKRFVEGGIVPKAFSSNYGNTACPEHC